MADPFHNCDDVHDAASDAVRAINERLRARGLQLVPEAFDSLRYALAEELSQVLVEGVEG